MYTTVRICNWLKKNILTYLNLLDSHVHSAIERFLEKHIIKAQIHVCIQTKNIFKMPLLGSTSQITSKQGHAIMNSFSTGELIMGAMSLTVLPWNSCFN